MSHFKRKKNKKKRKRLTPVSKRPASVRYKERAIEQLQKKGLGNNFKFVEQKLKISELILDFGSDLIEQMQDESESNIRKLIDFIIICWNIGAMEEEETREELISETINGIGTNTVEYDLRMLVDRKLKYYKEYRYIVVSHEVTFRKGSFHLNVVSSPIKKLPNDKKF